MSRPEWRSVRNDPPPVWTRVIVWLDNKPQLLSWVPDTCSWKHIWYDEKGNHYSEPEWWMPAPEKPEGRDE